MFKDVRGRLFSLPTVWYNCQKRADDIRPYSGIGGLEHGFAESETDPIAEL